ncbi:MAG: RNA-binding protein [Candidatus Krumholzibacteria bacterium]|nr:RNA-binding protein [Candidatus Krumholzibacteria bacterium]
MRVDLLLKALCLVKTRSEGRRGCVAGRVKINGKTAKPSLEVRAGDIVEIRYPRRILVVEITEAPTGQVARKERDRHIRVIREIELGFDSGE